MQTITQILAAELGCAEKYVQNVVALLDEGNTIPFIARYRKEAHGGMDDTALRTLETRLQYLRSLEARRAEVRELIAAQEKLTDALSAQIDAAATLAELEDIYRPFRPKRRTRATIAKEKGLEPLADAIAAGNTVVLKPSATAPATAEVVAGIVRECFTEDYVCVVTGGREENADLLSMRWDKIFFTGSAATGKAVMRAASEHLTSVTLELGGKSPVIVDSTADIALTAKRLTYGKLLNCGQTCVAPDYVLCDERVHDELVAALRREMAAQVPDALHDPTYGRMASARHFERVRALIDPAKLVYGGGCDADTLKIEPTILDGVSPDDAVMGEEIFGPVLPVLTYGSLEEAVAFVESRPRPLALYLFTSSRENKRYVLSRCRFGGGCVNDCIMHLTTHSLPFGGMGASGTGAYHGRWGFEAFSHLEGILHRGTACDPALRYRPFTDKKLSMIRRVMR